MIRGWYCKEKFVLITLRGERVRETGISLGWMSHMARVQTSLIYGLANVISFVVFSLLRCKWYVDSVSGVDPWPTRSYECRDQKTVLYHPHDTDWKITRKYTNCFEIFANLANPRRLSNCVRVKIKELRFMKNFHLLKKFLPVPLHSPVKLWCKHSYF